LVPVCWAAAASAASAAAAAAAAAVLSFQAPLLPLLPSPLLAPAACVCPLAHARLLLHRHPHQQAPRWQPPQQQWRRLPLLLPLLPLLLLLLQLLRL
jgi:hypothetical protein